MTHGGAPPDALQIVVPGVSGRMGLLIAQAAHDDARVRLAGASVRPGGYGAGDDVGDLLAVGSKLGIEVMTDVDDSIGAATVPTAPFAIIDFTVPSALFRHTEVAAERGAALVVGTTGLEDAHRAALDEVAKKVPVLQAANTSLGANLLAGLSAKASVALEGSDAEIVELHHKHKKDAPSGTALMVARAIAAARGQTDEVLRLSREGHAPRKAGNIGVFGVRGGDVVGEHTVYLFADGERLELTHRVTDRAIFARGAVAAARAISGRAPGRYTMSDVLGL